MLNKTPKYMPRSERRELNLKGLDFCYGCKTVKPISEFKKNEHRCKACSKKQFSDWTEKNKGYMKAYRSKNVEKRTKYNKKWNDEHKEQYLSTRRKWKALKRQTNPSWYMLEKLRSCISRLKSRETHQRTLSYIQLPSVEEFISKMTEKTDNKSWISDRWHIDHIWQLNWFSKALENPRDEVLSAINRYQNLRPLSPEENCKRDILDFSPLSKEDFPIYEPYLNEDIREKIKIHFGL